MRPLLFSLLIVASTFSFAEDENCDPNSNRTITSLQIPNCLSSEAVRQQLNHSRMIEFRRESGLPVPTTPGEVCGECLESFNVSAADPVPLKDKQDAFFKTAYLELEKSLSSIAFDIAGLRSNWAMGSSFTASAEACNTSAIETALRNCNSPFLSAFRSKDLPNRIAGEIASLISTNRTSIDGILKRPDPIRTCPISDITASNLRQYLFEDAISPQLIRQIISIEATGANQFQANLSSALGQDTFDLLLNHPILRNLLQDPQLFKTTFSQVSTSGSNDSIKASFRSAIHNANTGSAIDRSNARRCSETISSFTTSLCSENFRTGNFSLGPFSNYQKFHNDKDLPTSEAESSNTDKLSAGNAFALQFCQSSNAPSLNLGTVLNRMTGSMPLNDRQSTHANFVAEKYEFSYGDLKNKMCAYHPATTCPDSDGDPCKLYKKYLNRLNTPEGRIATSSDPNVNNILRSLIGNSQTVSGPVKQLLIAEGILPQADGTTREQPRIPEREPDYLQGVAEGRINPSTSGSGVTNGNRQQRPQPSQSGTVAGFQPQGQQQLTGGGQNTVVSPDTEEDDSLDRQVFEDLEARRLRGEQLNPQQTRQLAQLRPRFTGRDPGSRTGTRIGPSVPRVQDTQAATAAVTPSLPAPSNPGGARLDADPNAQTRADRDRNAALSQMSGARVNATSSGDADRSPAGSAEGQTGEQTIALTVTGDIRANLERVLNGEDTRGLELRNKLREKVPFRFQLNNSLFDVQFTNGTCVVTARNRDARSGELARELQRIFNGNLRRTAATLENLNQNLRN